jgi:hypothetical protein
MSKLEFIEQNYWTAVEMSNSDELLAGALRQNLGQIKKN